MKTIFTVILILSFTSAFSQNTIRIEKPKDTIANQVIGVFGVCNGSTSNILMTINTDGTYQVIDRSIPNNAMTNEGRWVRKKKYIILKDLKTNVSFPNKWTLSKNNTVATGRNRMAFYRLVNLQKEGD